MINKKTDVYITQSNLKSILNKVDKRAYKLDICNIYKTDLRKILSTPELNLLCILKETYENQNIDLEAYLKIKRQDTKRFVFEGGSPSYHFTPNCERLNSKFSNFEIPVEIQERGDNSIRDFRAFFRENISTLKQDESLFLRKLDARFNLKNPPSKVSYDNSGYCDIQNINLEELEKMIDFLLLDAESFRNKDELTRKKIQNQGFGTDRAPEAKKPGTVLHEWHTKYKGGLKYLLGEYFRVKFNSEIKFDGDLLEALGFKPCKNCAPLPPST